MWFGKCVKFKFRQLVESRCQLYIIEIVENKCLSGETSYFLFFLDGRSCTGTLVVLLEDKNDHPPQIKEKELTICRHDKDFAVLEPIDQDGPDNGPPFQFILDNSASKLWTVETRDGV